MVNKFNEILPFLHSRGHGEIEIKNKSTNDDEDEQHHAQNFKNVGWRE